jgi:hypothetical protein
MNDQASFTLRGRNPDVLTCIANLSNDEVFTPPEFANRMLDRLTDVPITGKGVEILKSREPLGPDRLFSAAELQC